MVQVCEATAYYMQEVNKTVKPGTIVTISNVLHVVKTPGKHSAHAEQVAPGTTPIGTYRIINLAGVEAVEMLRIPADAAGIPYAEQVSLSGRTYSVCPCCGVYVRLKKVKDRESYTGQEYARHFKKYHTA